MGNILALRSKGGFEDRTIAYLTVPTKFINIMLFSFKSGCDGFLFQFRVKTLTRRIFAKFNILMPAIFESI